MKIKILYLLFIPLLLSCNSKQSESKQDVFPFEQGEKIGFFNLKGEIVIQPQFISASLFSDDVALVQTDIFGEYSYIDKEGKFIFKSKYEYATIFNEGKAMVVDENGFPAVINKAGETLFVLKDVDDLRIFNEDLAAFSIGNDTIESWGFVNVKGEKVIQPQYAKVDYFFEGKCAVQNREGKWGYIDKSGKLIIDYKFDVALEFENGKAVVYIEDKAGVINSKGEYLIKPQYDYILNDGENFIIEKDYQHGWCDKNGKISIKPSFKSASGFNGSDLAAIQNEKGYGYINKNGKLVIDTKFEIATSFFGDFAIVKSGGKYGLIDKNGEFIMKTKFDGFPADLFMYINFNGKFKTSSLNHVMNKSKNDL